MARCRRRSNPPESGDSPLFTRFNLLETRRNAGVEALVAGRRGGGPGGAAPDTASPRGRCPRVAPGPSARAGHRWPPQGRAGLRERPPRHPPGPPRGRGTVTFLCGTTYWKRSAIRVGRGDSPLLGERGHAVAAAFCCVLVRERFGWCRLVLRGGPGAIRGSGGVSWNPGRVRGRLDTIGCGRKICPTHLLIRGIEPGSEGLTRLDRLKDAWGRP